MPDVCKPSNICYTVRMSGGCNLTRWVRLKSHTRFIIFLLLKILFFGSTAYASVLHFSPQIERYQLNPYATYCIQNKEINASSIHLTQMIATCKKQASSHIPNGYIDQNIWTLITLEYSKKYPGTAKRIVELDSPLLDYVDLYIFEQGKLIAHYKTGDKRPSSSRPILSRDFRFPVKLKPGDTVTLLLNIRSSSAIKLPLSLIDPKTLAVEDVNQYLIFGIFYGILIILALYNLIFFFIFRKPVYLFYVIFVFAYTLMQASFDGLATRYLWPDNLWLSNNAVPFFVNIAVISAILFGQYYLDTKKNTPKINIVLNIIILANAAMMLLFILDIYRFAVQLTAMFAMLTPLTLIIAAIVSYHSNPRNIQFYLLAWSLFFLGTIFMALFKLGYLPPVWWVLHSQQIGVIFKVLILSYALGEQLQRLMYVDQLTGTWNRQYVDAIFKSAKNYADKIQTPFAIITMDIDDFKIINDSLTHKAGDTILKKLAKRLKNHLRTTDTVLRLGQDEFLIVLEKIDNANDLPLIADQILTQIRKPFSLSNQMIHITASMGIALYPQDGEALDSLIKNSDNALHRAKDLGKNNFQFFNRTLDQAAMLKLQLHNDLFSALEKNELYLMYQPKIDTATGNLTGFEALLRWKHPTRGLIGPDIFIAIAEQNDLILHFTRWIIKKVCLQLQLWHQNGLININVAINITAKDLKDDHFIPDTLNIIKEHNLSTDMFEFELTERMLIEDNESGLNRIRKLSDSGFSIAIDDFGTGYSSFSYLQNYIIHTMKIDKSFIDQLEFNQQTRTIVTAMIGLGHHLGMKIVAEGVENAQQYKILKLMNCDILQGYYIDKPLLVKEISSKYY